MHIKMKFNNAAALLGQMPAVRAATSVDDDNHDKVNKWKSF